MNKTGQFGVKFLQKRNIDITVTYETKKTLSEAFLR
jgi:hypothetical protein